MQAILSTQFETIERQRRAIQARALALNAAQLAAKEAPNAWSVQQVVEHLVLSDETLGQAQETPQTEALMFRVLPRALVLFAFKRDAVLPLPSPAVEPSGNMPLPELLERWDQARARMRLAVEEVRDNEPRWSHLVLGPLNAIQMLTLSETHTAYHLLQMDSILRADTREQKEQSR